MSKLNSWIKSLKVLWFLLLLLVAAAWSNISLANGTDTGRSAGPPAAVVIYTNIPGEPSADVPGLPGVHFEPGTGTTHFDRVYGSTNGNWALTADTDLPITEDEVMLVNDVVEIREGTAATWATGENVGLLDQKLGVNNAGEYVFTTNTDGPTTADEYVLHHDAVTVTVAAQEGMSTTLSTLPTTSWGSTLETAVITNDGTVGFAADLIAGVPTTEDEILVFGSALLAQEGVTVPAGQIGSEAWENFDIGDFFVSADASNWLVQGDLAGAITTDDVVAVNGDIVVQEGTILPGSGFSNPVDDSGIIGVFMDAGGNWYVRGNNDTTEQDWVYSNGAVIASSGSPIHIGASENYSDTDFSDTFFLHVANSNGDYVIGGVTDGPTLSNGVIVLNNEIVIIRESDPIDLDGNGTFDDDAYFDTFGNDDAHLTDTGIFYIVATIKDSTETRIGQGFLSLDISGLLSSAPVINVMPDSLSSEQYPDVQITQTLTISNSGDADLVWDIYEDASTFGGGGWSDNFDSYATGSQMHGQGGWKGWDNSPAAGALTTDVQSFSAPNSVDIVGVSDLVHEYSGYTSGQWIYTAHQYIPAGYSGNQMFILLNTYNDGGPNNWSTQVRFESASNQVISDFDGATLPIITDQWVELRVEIDLDADVQTFYYDGQMLYQKSWAEGVSGGGAANIAAVDLWGNSSGSIYYDNLSLQAPVATCDAPDPIDWISVTPMSGTLPALAAVDLDVTFDSTGYAAGVYTGTLCINSNDALNPVVSVPLTMTVLMNEVPIAANDAYTTTQDAVLSVPAPGVLSNDSDGDGQPLSAVLDTNPSHGTLDFNVDGSFTYTPTFGFDGSDSFTYHADDGLDASNVATVTLTVLNAAPVAADDAYAIEQDTVLTVTVPGILGNDVDDDGDSLTAVLDSDVSHGTLTLNGDGSFAYMPDDGFVGEDSFTYHANDGSDDSNVATVTITVTAMPITDYEIYLPLVVKD